MYVFIYSFIQQISSTICVYPGCFHSLAWRNLSEILMEIGLLATIPGRICRENRRQSQTEHWALLAHKQGPSERYQETEVKVGFLKPREMRLREGVLTGGRWYKEERWTEP